MVWTFPAPAIEPDQLAGHIRLILRCHAILIEISFIGPFFDCPQSRIHQSFDTIETATTIVQLINVFICACCISTAFTQYIAKIDMLSFSDFNRGYTKFKPRTIGSFSDSGILSFYRSALPSKFQSECKKVFFGIADRIYCLFKIGVISFRLVSWNECFHRRKSHEPS